MKETTINFAAAKRRPTNSRPANRRPANNRAYAKAANNTRRRRRRTGRKTLHYLLVFAVAALIMMILSMTVFFKIETLDVAGTTHYAKEEIIAASGIEIGDNLFAMNDKKIVKKLIETFSYIEDVKLKRTFPPSLTIEIEQAEAMSVLDMPGGYTIIGKNGRILEIGAAVYPEGVMLINGLSLHDPQVGSIMGESASYETPEQEQQEKESLQMLLHLEDALAQTGFTDVTYIDFSDRFNILLVYQNRILIELGTDHDLTYKLRNIIGILESDRLGSDFEGIFYAFNHESIHVRPMDIHTELENRKAAAQGENLSEEEPSGGEDPAELDTAQSDSSSGDAQPVENEPDTESPNSESGEADQGQIADQGQTAVSQSPVDNSQAE